METQYVPRCGDVVLHRPSGETWSVAYADPERNELSWFGWPEGTAKLSDCELVKRCSDARHLECVADWLGRSSNRAQHVFRLYGLAMLPVEMREKLAAAESALSVANRAQSQARQEYLATEEACWAAVRALARRDTVEPVEATDA